VINVEVAGGIGWVRLAHGKVNALDAYLPALIGAFRAVFSVGKPVVAAVNGHAIAGGCVLAAACDYRVMATGNGVVGVPELRVGVPFPAAAYEIMRYALGPVGARKVITDGTNYPASEALALGLVDELTAPADLAARATAVADRLAASIPADTFRFTKRQFHGEIDERLDACAASGEPDMVNLWKAGAADGRIQAFMDRTVGSRQRS